MNPRMILLALPVFLAAFLCDCPPSALTASKPDRKLPATLECVSVEMADGTYVGRAMFYPVPSRNADHHRERIAGAVRAVGRSLGRVEVVKAADTIILAEPTTTDARVRMTLGGTRTDGCTTVCYCAEVRDAPGPTAKGGSYGCVRTACGSCEVCIVSCPG